MDQNVAQGLGEPSLAQQTRVAKGQFINGLAPAAQETVGAAFERLLQSDVAALAKTVGDQAPDFQLPNVTGTPIGLRQMLAQGPVVLSFYRGGWCPFCSLELHAPRRWTTLCDTPLGRGYKRL